MHVEMSARKHGVPDEDMLHALRHHWRAYETDDPDVTMFIGPSSTAEPLEVGVVADDEGTAVIHAMKAREKFLEWLVDQMRKTRDERTKAMEEWADCVDPTELRYADTEVLRTIAALAQRRAEVEADLTAAVCAARRARRSWSEIGAMLGVSKQAAQRKYVSKVPASPVPVAKR